MMAKKKREKKKPKLVVYDVLNDHINRVMINSIFLYFPLIFKKV